MSIQQGMEFFWPQIVQAAAAGVLLSLIGLFVVLRRIIFGGLAIAQSSGTVMAFLLTFGLSTAWMLPLTALVTVPLLYAALFLSGNREAWAGVLFLICTAASEAIVSLGARAQMHEVQAVSGNVLAMTGVSWPVAGGSLLWLAVFSFSARFMVRVFFDRDHAQLYGDRPAAADGLFFTFLFSAVAFGTMQMGAFYTMAHLIVPAAAAVPVSQGIARALALSAALSAAATVGGFLISFVSFGESGAHIPTSSAVILCLGVLFLITRVSAGVFFLRRKD